MLKEDVEVFFSDYNSIKNDIDYIIEEWDDVEVEKPKKQTLILPKKKEIIV